MKCPALLAEKRRDFGGSLEGYTACLAECREDTAEMVDVHKHPIGFIKDFKGMMFMFLLDR